MVGDVFPIGNHLLPFLLSFAFFFICWVIFVTFGSNENWNGKASKSSLGANRIYARPEDPSIYPISYLLNWINNALFFFFKFQQIFSWWKIIEKIWKIIENILNNYWKNFKKFLKTFWKFLEKFWKILEKILKNCWKNFEKFLKYFWNIFEKNLKNSWKHFEKFLKNMFKIFLRIREIFENLTKKD